MASLARRTSSSSAPLRRKGPSPQIAKLKERLKSVAKRARGAHKSDKEKTLLTVAGGAGLALLEKKLSIPTVMGLDPGLIPGAILALGAPKFVGGRNGQRLQAIGDGVLAAVAARSVSRGSVKVSGVEIGADDDDDDLTTP